MKKGTGKKGASYSSIAIEPEATIPKRCVYTEGNYCVYHLYLGAHITTCVFSSTLEVLFAFIKSTNTSLQEDLEKNRNLWDGARRKSIAHWLSKDHSFRGHSKSKMSRGDGCDSFKRLKCNTFCLVQYLTMKALVKNKNTHLPLTKLC